MLTTDAHKKPLIFKIIAIIAISLLAILGLPASAGAASPAPAGTYTGTSTAYTGATISFTVDANGVMADVNTESYLFCGSFPTPIQWTGMPPTALNADGSFDVTWFFGDPDNRVKYTLSGVVGSNGQASGQGRATMPDLGCSGLQFTFNATVGGTSPLTPKITANPTTLTVSQLANPGTVITGTDFPPNSPLSATFDGQQMNGNVSTNANGGFQDPVTGTNIAPGQHTIAYTAGGKTASTTITVNADPVIPDPTVTADPTTLTVSQLASSGTHVTGKDFAASTAITVALDGSNVGTTQSDNTGKIDYTFTKAGVAPGAHTLSFTAAGKTATVDLTVNADPVIPDPTVNPDSTTFTVSQMVDPGVHVTGRDFAANSTVTVKFDGADAGTTPATGEGRINYTFSKAGVAPGAHTLSFTAAGKTATVDLTVNPDPVIQEPTVAADPATLTVSQLASSGTHITGKDFPPSTGAFVTLDGNDAGTAQVANTGRIDYIFTKAGVAPGVHTLSFTAAGKTATLNLTVNADPVIPDPTVTATPTTLTVSQLANPGTHVTGKDFAANSTVTVKFDGADAGTTPANGEGKIDYTFTKAGVAPGVHTLSFTAAGKTATVNLTVNADPVIPDPTVTATPTTLTVDQLANPGIVVVGKDFPANAQVVVTFDGANPENHRADASGKVSFTYQRSGVAPGQHKIQFSWTAFAPKQRALLAAAAAPQLEVTITVKANTPPTTPKPSANASTSNLSVSELGSKGIQVTGSNFGANASVKVLFDGQLVSTEVADQQGVLNFLFKKAGVTPGSHTLTLQSGDTTLSLAVTVTADSALPTKPGTSAPQTPFNPGDGDGLPNTGMEFIAPTGIAILLMASGIAAFFMARSRFGRRAKA
ncbi:hypothetical protein [Psychromicrobium sp. YIM B11713]|uniref:hypothetical protein n=1 Tax=Psychromicrobium sp. YIM B11713 TaxID=3145233 RepID=UPI00374E7207